MSTDEIVADAALAVPGDTHYEIDLGDTPPSSHPVAVDLTRPKEDWLPVIPAHLRGWANIRRTADRAWGRLKHRAGYHGLRSPVYLVLTVVYAVVGVFRLEGRQLAWFWVREQSGLRWEASKRLDWDVWLKLHKHVLEVRRTRGIVLALEHAALAGAGVALALLAPWWAWAAALVAVVPLLARHGRPPDKRIIGQAVVTPRFRKLNSDIVLRAYYAAKLGNPDKEGQRIVFPSIMSRDGEGSRVLVDLPYGLGLKDAIAAKDKIASGLDVTESQVFIRRDPTSARRHTLWVADRDPLAVPVGRTPLLACQPTDIWKPAPLGLDERGQAVAVPLIWNSVLVSALPRAGKTFSARLLGLYAALDPYVRLSVFDFKGSPDWRKFALVADTCAFGLTQTRDGLPLDIFMDTLLELKRDAQDRYQKLSDLPADVCPEGKLTRAIAHDPAYGMPVRLLLMDEFQEVYDLPDGSKEIAALLTFLVKVAPGAGIILLGSTQRPSGVGSGGVAQQFTSFRDNFAIRFGLRTSSWQVSELCLGAGAYSEGLDTSTLLPEYKGVGILRGASDLSPTVRCHLADGKDAEKILTAARAIRRAAGTLGGQAAGEIEAPADVLADVMAVFGSDAGLQWPVLAARLAQRIPGRWADATADSVSAAVRSRGVPVAQVKQFGRNLNGCRREDVVSAQNQGVPV